MRRLMIAAAMLAAMKGVGAQQMYRCGNSFSQTPCGAKDEKTVAMRRDLPSSTSSTPARAEVAEECKRQLSSQLKDPYSAQFAVYRGPVDVFTIHDSPMEARKYFMSVNAKNSYGGYVGHKTYICVVTLDDSRVLQIISPGG